MAGNDVDDSARFARLIEPNSIAHLATVLLRWLQDAHDAARSVQRHRTDEERGAWDNTVSFGTDRYQFLVRTAASLTSELPELVAGDSYRSLLLKLSHVALYPFRVDEGPHSPIRAGSDLRTELLSDDSSQWSLLRRKDLLTGGRELALVPWTGTENDGCTGLWAGQGALRGNLIDWDWLVELTAFCIGFDVPATRAPTMPITVEGPAAFDQASSELAFRTYPTEDAQIQRLRLRR
ncbi:MAG: hypothetical protein JOZ47_14185 [Kutzneria sp.]|nr:hypothetical protein [Kutzneria sp.]MBV9846201.1 hypothetical protein [Kutzneria sp.]